MADLKISAMTPRTPATGIEILAVSAAAASRSILVSDIVTFTVDEIEGIIDEGGVGLGALASVDGNDFIMMLENGTTLKPTDIDNVAQHGIDTMWGKDRDADPDNADIMLLQDGGTTEKTVTLAKLAAYTLATNEASILDVTSLDDGSGAFIAADYMLVTQGTTGKKIQASDMSTLVLGGLAAHVKATSAVVTPADADEMYILQSDVGTKITLAQIKTYLGTRIGGSGIAARLAQWDDSDTLKAGPMIGVAADGFTSAGSDTVVPSTALVRGEMNEIINDATDIGAAIVDADTLLVDDGGAGTQKKSTMSRLYTYIFGKLPYISEEVDGTLPAGNNSLTADKLVVAKTTAAAVDVITLANGTELGKVLTIFLDAVAGGSAVITPATAVSYTKITVDTQYQIATLQWQGAKVGWAILYTNGEVE